MCGILGFYECTARPRPQMAAIGAAMARSIAQRGPDDEGLWQDPYHHLLLGHRRLAIIDLSPEGHQPMASHTGRYEIVFNGEIYNFPDLQRELAGANIPFRGRSDTEIMLAAFEHWGVNRTLQKLNGMFAFVLWDRETGQLHFARDRLGKKPLYVGWCGQALVFGSTLSVFHAHPDFTARINRDVLALYMRYSCVPAPYSIYDSVWQLLPGCRITLDIGTLANRTGMELQPLMEPYWHPARVIEEARAAASAPANDAAAIDAFEGLLRRCVKDRMMSDVPLGAFLSGGIDSTTIVALMQHMADQPVKTFTIGFHESGYDEARHAKAVAAHLGTDHHELYLSAQDALGIVPRLPEIYDEPFADASQIPTYMVCRFAREHVTVALSGDGGDEMLGGYTRHVAVPALWRRIGWVPPGMRHMMARGVEALGPDTWNKLVPFYPRFGDKLYKTAAILPLADEETAYRQLISTWADPAADPGALVRGAREPAIPLDDPAWQPRGLNFAERMMYGDALSYLPNDVMVKVDRASMAVALEARAPLLDRRIFEHVWGLDASLKVRQGKGKWLLRQVLARYVPDALMDRPKQGFGVPVSAWLNGPLRDWAEDLLDPTRLQAQGYLDPALVQAVWAAHKNGAHQHGQRLWTVLMFQSWLERWDSGRP